MTAGMQVPLESTFAKLLEERLNQREGSEQWQVVNASVNAYGTDNELLFYELEGRKYDPNYVILGMYLANDIYNNHRELEVGYGGSGHKPYYRLRSGNELELFNFPVEETDTFFVRIGSFVKRNFQLPRAINEILKLRSQIPDLLRPLTMLIGGARGAPAGPTSANTFNRRGDICEEEYTPQIEEAWAITKALILELRDAVEDSDAHLAVLVIPASPQLEPPNEGEEWYCVRANTELDSFLKEVGIPHLDLLEPFQQHILFGGAPLYYRSDFHMNENGHRLAESLLSEFVLTEFVDF